MNVVYEKRLLIDSVAYIYSLKFVSLTIYVIQLPTFQSITIHNNNKSSDRDDAEERMNIHSISCGFLHDRIIYSVTKAGIGPMRRKNLSQTRFPDSD